MRYVKTWLRTALPNRQCAMVLMVVAALLIGGCNSSSALHPLPTVQMTPTTNPKATFPAFTDVRVGYLGADKHLHAVTLDGKQDLIGPLVDNLLPKYFNFWSTGTSPDGHYFVYPGNTALAGHSTMDILDLRSQTDFDHAVAYVQGDGNDPMFWSQDSMRLAYSTSPGSDTNLRTLNLTEGTWQLTSPVHTNLKDGPTGVTGWLGEQHLLIQDTQYINNSTEYYSYLYSVDTNTGAARRITALTRRDQGTQFFIPSPDGSSILYYNRPFRDDPFTYQLAIIDVATGAIHALPHALHAMMPNSQYDPATHVFQSEPMTSVAWNPSHHTIAVSTGSQLNNDVQGWLINLDHDSVSPLPSKLYMESWTPAGNVLIGSTMGQSQVGMGPATLSAITITGPGQYSTVQLTNAEYTFPFVGFIRSA